MGPNYHVIIDDYHDVEDLMLDLIQSFDAREEVPFTFQADSFTVVHEVDQKVREIRLQEDTGQDSRPSRQLQIRFGGLPDRTRPQVYRNERKPRRLC